jgi:Cft2 family RNA processing exonuclease
VIVEVGGKRVMFDCGLHMVSEQKFPDFSYLLSPAAGIVP